MYNQDYIKEKIDENNKIIESLMTPNQFTLNNTIARLLRENSALQKHCKQQFDNGDAIDCYKEK